LEKFLGKPSTSRSLQGEKKKKKGGVIPLNPYERSSYRERKAPAGQRRLADRGVSREGKGKEKKKKERKD